MFKPGGHSDEIMDENITRANKARFGKLMDDLLIDSND